MSLSRGFIAIALFALAVPAAAQDWKGMGRMEGKLLDPDGKPIAEATVKLDLSGRGGTTLKTDKKGKWAIGGIAAGVWNLDFEAPGYPVKKVSITLPSEGERIPPVEVKLDKPAGPPPELVEAIEKGNEAYKAGRWTEARTEYEKLLALRPDLAPTLRMQIARCYSQEGNYEKELEVLQQQLDASPGDANLITLMAQEALKGGMLDRGMGLLQKIDESTVKDPDVFFNIAVLLLNQQKPEEAVTYLTKSITVDPAFTDGYFQRGLAYLQLQKIPESKADFQKVLELAPEGPQAETAKKALEQLK
jgi:tetratricopeptide (TPR) repeat protein